MSWVAVAIGGAAVVGAISSNMAAGKAADAQGRAAQSANDAQAWELQKQREDNAPWRNAGVSALTDMQDKDYFQKDFSMKDFTADPGYQYRLDEGNKAINAAASARGMGNSGATMKALAKFGQDHATNEYQNVYNRFNNDRTTRFNRLASLSGSGQTANQQVGQAGSNAANQMGQNMMGAGNSQAAAQMAGSNAFNSAIGTGMNSWMNYQMNKPTQPPIPTGGSGGGSAGGSWGSFDNMA